MVFFTPKALACRQVRILVSVFSVTAMKASTLAMPSSSRMSRLRASALTTKALVSWLVSSLQRSLLISKILIFRSFSRRLAVMRPTRPPPTIITLWMLICFLPLSLMMSFTACGLVTTYTMSASWNTVSSCGMKVFCLRWIAAIRKSICWYCSTTSLTLLPMISASDSSFTINSCNLPPEKS